MKSRVFGNTGAQVPVIGQGTWQIGQSAVAALRAGIDLGMTHIDTAEMYRGAEAVVAEAMRGRRNEVFLVSKVLPSNASREGTVAACEQSLKRLGTDHLDCYLLHWPGQHRLEDTIAAFEALVSAGKIRSWGLSNFDVAELEHAERIAGAGRIACNQVLYHVQERAIEHAVLPWCAAHRVALVAYSPFGSGSFPSAGSKGGRVLQEIAARRGATARQVALAFLLRHSGVFVIPKAADPEHASDNAAAGDLDLAQDDIAAIDAAFPASVKKHLPML